MITIGTTLAIFLMLGISSLAVFLAKRINIPHTVLLVLIGIGLGILSKVSTFSFLSEFKLTPELLFYLFLPTLIFESAYNINIRKLIADSGAVMSLAIGSFLVSTTLISTLLYLLLPLIGVPVPFIITVLFGALISATDPVAVLSLFKEYGVPRRLALIFEGESLFNDATAVAVFLITLEAIHSGGFTALTSITGLFTFISMLVLGVLFGLIVGGVFTYLVGAAKQSDVASITLTIVLAHITFIMAEVISGLQLFGLFTLHISPIISTTVASLLMGNYGRAKMSQHTEIFVTHIWEQFAFMANSLVFILIGILMIDVLTFNLTTLLAIATAILVVATSRALSIYPIISLYNLSQDNNKQVPRTWQHLLAWGSLRGALAITMVLLIPDTMTVPNWTLEMSPKEFLLSITTGCIAATLFIKALSIKSFISHFKLDKLTAVEEIEYQEARALMHHRVTEQLTKYQQRGYIDSSITETLLFDHSTAFQRACSKINSLSQADKHHLTLRVLRIFAIGIEKKHLKVLYDHHEISELSFRRIDGKLRLQLESIEVGDLSPDVTIHADSRDIFDRFFGFIKKMVGRKENIYSFDERYIYYRAQAIISRKVLKEFTLLDNSSSIIFTDEAVQHVENLYKSFRENSEKKLLRLTSENSTRAKQLAESIAGYSVKNIEETVLEDIHNNELITQKLYLILKDELTTSNL